MPTLREIRQAFDRARRLSEDRDWVRGRLGRINPDGSVSIKVSKRPGYVYVRTASEGNMSVTVARNMGVPLRAHLPVKMKMVNGVMTVYGVDDSGGLIEQFANNSGSFFSVPYHTHAIGSGMEYPIESLRLLPGLVTYSTGMVVAISAFRYYFLGNWYTYTGGTLDLTPYKPATTGNWRWVVVCMDPTTNSPTAVTGPEVATSTSLSLSDIDSLDFGVNIPLMAIRVRESDTAVNKVSDYFDARAWLNIGSGDVEEVIRRSWMGI